MTASAETPNQKRKPRLAFAIATALGVGYAPKAPGTFGSLVGVVTIFLSAVFFLHPEHWTDLFSLHPLSDATLMDRHFLVPGSDMCDAAMWLRMLCAFALLIFVGLAGVWASHLAADYSGLKDPQFVVVDEVAGQHLTLVLPLIPIAMPHLQAHVDFSVYAIFAALSLVNWKYLLAGFLLFRLFDILKPCPIKGLGNLPGGCGTLEAACVAAVC